MAQKQGDQSLAKLTVDLGGGPIDLNAGMIEAVTNPPNGFVSKRQFQSADVGSRLKAINWFSQCGHPVSCDLSMEMRLVTNWDEAIESCKARVWENVQLEAQNQLTIWLHLNDHANYQRWNEYVDAHKSSFITPLTESVLVPFQVEHDLDAAFVHSAQWDILGALMANAYLGSKHRAFFFLELLSVYEVGHFPCGWDGEWPKGKLVVY